MVKEFRTLDSKSASFSGEAKATHPGKLGDHPVGGATGAAVGAAAGGAAVAAASGVAAGAVAAGGLGAVQGAIMGAPGGPLGVAAGAAVGGVVGALAGKGIAQIINPTTEDAYWSENYKDRDYVVAGDTYDTYRPAYMYGVDMYDTYNGRPYDEIEAEARDKWERDTNLATLPWHRASRAARDAYDRVHTRRSEFASRDFDNRTGE